MTFNGAPSVRYFCLEDEETRKYFQTDNVLKNKKTECSNKCFQENIKIDKENREFVYECPNLEYNN